MTRDGHIKEQSVTLPALLKPLDALMSRIVAVGSRRLCAALCCEEAVAIYRSDCWITFVFVS